MYSQHWRTLFCCFCIWICSILCYWYRKLPLFANWKKNFHSDSSICSALGMYGRVATYTLCLHSFSTWHCYFLVCTTEETALPILQEFVNHSPESSFLQIFLFFYQHPAWFISPYYSNFIHSSNSHFVIR